MEVINKKIENYKFDFEIGFDNLGLLESMVITREQISKMKEKDFINLVSKKIIDTVNENELGG